MGGGTFEGIRGDGWTCVVAVNGLLALPSTGVLPKKPVDALLPDSVLIAEGASAVRGVGSCSPVTSTVGVTSRTGPPRF